MILSEEDNHVVKHLTCIPSYSLVSSASLFQRKTEATLRLFVSPLEMLPMPRINRTHLYCSYFHNSVHRDVDCEVILFVFWNNNL